MLTSLLFDLKQIRDQVFFRLEKTMFYCVIQHRPDAVHTLLAKKAAFRAFLDNGGRPRDNQ
ncbi:hypothetical protein CalGV039 [Clostera anastomosis granulovirus A]|uniref:Uncharacterized protein n=1 Tax=Clostera anastomosis granulovirus A TaxID=1986289 RepID=U5KBK7_9BBAC|nr:hypothetical protein CalGV039 [Clostera anastomosis granulovirus Henan]AGQ20298.1 hypothetical protein CalGV039 [Clostera anastomosis granulovirus Henan]